MKSEPLDGKILPTKEQRKRIKINPDGMEYFFAKEVKSAVEHHKLWEYQDWDSFWTCDRCHKDAQGWHSHPEYRDIICNDCTYKISFKDVMKGGK